MRTAICFSGQPRQLDIKNNLCQRLLEKNLKEPNENVDVFIHSWYHPALIGKPFHPNKPYDMGAWKGGEDELMIKLYNPVRYKFEHPNVINPRLSRFDPKGYHQHGHIGLDATYCMFYSICAANELRREYEKLHNFKYDAVVRMRFDLAIDTPIKISSLDLSKINTPVNPGGRGGYRCCDFFAISSGKNMTPYSNTYIKLDMMIHELWINDNERLLGLNLQKYKGLEISEVWKWMEDIWFTGYDISPKSVEL